MKIKVGITSPGNWHIANVTFNGNKEHLKASLKSLLGYYNSKANPSDLATSFIKYGQNFGVFLNGDIYDGDCMITLSPFNKIESVFLGYNGSIQDFLYEKPVDYSGKIVQFWYAGGTKHGVRIVNVEKCYDGLIVGVDLNKDETRNYLREKISNIIIVGNSLRS